MKSRISIDVDYDNQPIIKIEYENSDDVRDKLVKKFLETFGPYSRFATFEFQNPLQREEVNKTAQIRPLEIKHFQYNWQDMKVMADDYEKGMRDKELSCAPPPSERTASSVIVN